MLGKSTTGIYTKELIENGYIKIYSKEKNPENELKEIFKFIKSKDKDNITYIGDLSLTIDFLTASIMSSKSITQKNLNKAFKLFDQVSVCLS